MAVPRRLGARAMSRALTLAEEQGEAEYFRQALAYIKRMERKINHPDVPVMLRGRLGIVSSRIRGKRAYTIVKEQGDAPDNRDGTAELQRQILGLLQNSLKRFLLLKSCRAGFSVFCTREQFFKLTQGHVAIEEHATSGYLRAIIEEKSTKEAVKQLGLILGIEAETTEQRWFGRRYYGDDANKTRDCAYVHVDQTVKKKQKIVLAWRIRKIVQFDRDGVKRESSFEKLFIRFPRNCKSVKPKKK